jgi:hypothetical protein
MAEYIPNHAAQLQAPNEHEPPTQTLTKYVSGWAWYIGLLSLAFIYLIGMLVVGTYLYRDAKPKNPRKAETYAGMFGAVLLWLLFGLALLVWPVTAVFGGGWLFIGWCVRKRGGRNLKEVDVEAGRPTGGEAEREMVAETLSDVTYVLSE